MRRWSCWTCPVRSQTDILSRGFPPPPPPPPRPLSLSLLLLFYFPSCFTSSPRLLLLISPRSAGNNLTSESAAPLASVLAKSPVLRDLSLASNSFGSRALLDILSQLARPTALQALDLSRNVLSQWPPGLSRQMASFEHLARIDVSFARITDRDFPLLVASLPPTLARLHARGTTVFPSLVRLLFLFFFTF